jgi:DNA (cytosine-5)-methyltransferase 1
MKPGVTLVDFARIWPTPTANDGRNATRKSGDFQSLTRSVMLPTPTCQDANNNGSTSQQNRNAPPLNAVVTNHDPAMRLNPEWVEELMGWPIGWTAAPQDSGPDSGKPSRE